MIKAIQKFDLGNDLLRDSNDSLVAGRRFFIILVLLLFYLKSISFIVNPQFWAEDGPVFFSDAWNIGWGSIIRLQAGYFVVVLRIVALFSTFLPIKLAPLICGSFTLILAACPVYLIFSKRSDPILPGVATKAIFALLYLVGPGSSEIYGNLTNLQWYLPVWIILFVFSTPSSNHVVRVLEYTFLFLMALTGPFIIFLFPIYGALVIFRRIKLDYTIAAILAVAFLVQVYAVFTTPQISGHLSISMLLKYISSKITLNGMFGIGGQRRIFKAAPGRFILIVGILVWFYSSARIILTGTAFTRVIVIFANLIFVAGCRKFADLFTMDPDVGARYAWFGVVTYSFVYYFIATRTTFKFERWIFYTLFFLGVIVGIPMDWSSFNAKSVNWQHEVRSFRWLNTGDTLMVNTDPVGWRFPIVKKQPSDIQKTEESKDINSWVILKIQNDRLMTTDAWAFIQNVSATGNQLFVVLKSSDQFYVIPSEPQLRPEVSAVFKQDCDWAGFTISRSIAHVKEGKYSFGLFIYNSQTGHRSLKYLSHDFEITHSGDLTAEKVWNL